jgi:molecular chaperone GrpE
MDAEMIDTPEGDDAPEGGDTERSADEFESEIEQLTDELGRPVDVGDVDVAALLAERDQFKDIALRLQADFDNYRKRAASQRSDEIERLTGKFAEALLPVLDACEAAFSHGADGVEPIWSQLIGVLQRQGLEATNPEGKQFDPTEAEAVLHEPADPAQEPGHPIVSEVLRTGYKWKGRTLRPAMVKVRG